MKNIVIMIMMLTIGLVNGQEKSKNHKVELDVKGNCEMCKKRIEKAAFATKGVKMASWNAETQKLTAVINDYKTDVATLETSIAAIGHDAGSVKATDEVYNNLHGCCKYDRGPADKACCSPAEVNGTCCAKKQMASCSSEKATCKSKCSSKKS